MQRLLLAILILLPGTLIIAAQGETTRSVNKLITRGQNGEAPAEGATITANGIRSDLNIALLGQLDPLDGALRYADVWGEGNYAYLATFNTPSPDNVRGSGVLIIDISDPRHPILAGRYHPASGARFQDVVVVNGIGYFSSENSGGVHIVDVRNPAAPQLLSHITAAQNGYTLVHELAVSDGILYLADSRTTVIKAFDVRTPALPVFIRNIQTTDTVFIHAITVLNGRLYTSGWGGTTDIFDIRDILTAPPPRLGSVSTGPNSHSSWVSSDGKLLVSARETTNGDVRVFDISDPANPQLRSTISAQSLGISALTPHNPYLIGHLLFVSWYQAGLQIINLSDPSQPVRVGEFDTYPDTAITGFRGCWGVFPFLGFDRVLLSDMDGGLYIVDTTSAANQTRAVRILPTTINRGQTGIVPIEFDALGNERTLQFSLEYDDLELSFAGAPGNDYNNLIGPGMPAGSTLIVNLSGLSNGRVGFILSAPADTAIPAGTRQILNLRMLAKNNGFNDFPRLEFGQNPIGLMLQDVDDGFLPLPTFTGATITLTLLNAPVPSIMSTHPTFIRSANTGLALYLSGANFVPSSVVRWNGSDRPTIYYGATALEATLSAEDLATPGTATVTVFNPAPGGGTSNAVTFTVAGQTAEFEADVAPRDTGGDGVFTLADWVQVGRLTFGLDQPSSGLEFQKADCAPRSTSGDGRLTLADWVQAGRYAAGIDPFAYADGPTAPNAFVSLGLRWGPVGAIRDERPRSPGNARRVLLSPIPSRGDWMQFSIDLHGLGDENAIAFSLEFDAKMLNFLAVAAADDGTGIHVDETKTGRIGIVAALRPGQSFGAGGRRVMVLRFAKKFANPTGQGARPMVIFGNDPAAGEVVTVEAATVAAVFGTADGRIGPYQIGAFRELEERTRNTRKQRK